MGDEFTPELVLEHQGFAAALTALHYDSVMYGSGNDQIYYRPDVFINLLVEHGFIKEDEVLGRLYFFGDSNLLRTAIGTPLTALLKSEADIREVISNHTHLDPDEVMKVLGVSSINGWSNGAWESYGTPLHNIYTHVSSYRRDTREAILNDAALLLTLASKSKG